MGRWAEVMKPRVPILTDADRLASKKLAYRYVNRKGGPPSIDERHRVRGGLARSGLSRGAQKPSSGMKPRSG